MRGQITSEILRSVIDAGPDGISAAGVMEVLASCGINASDAGVRGMLSRFTRDGSLRKRFDGRRTIYSA